MGVRSDVAAAVIRHDHPDMRRIYLRRAHLAYPVNRAKAKGTRGEVRVRDYLREHGFPYCERLPSEGSKDRGDLSIPGICVEVKTHKTITLASFMDELAVEKANAKVPIGVVIIPRSGSSIARAYVVQELAQWVETVA